MNAMLRPINPYNKMILPKPFGFKVIDIMPSGTSKIVVGKNKQIPLKNNKNVMLKHKTQQKSRNVGNNASNKNLASVTSDWIDTKLFVKGSGTKMQMLKIRKPVGGFDVDQLSDYISVLTNGWADKGYRWDYRIGLKGTNGRYCSTELVPIGEYVDIHRLVGNYSEYEDVINEIDVAYIFASKHPAGGNSSKTNDCLYDCIVEALGSVPRVCTVPATFKKILGLSRNAMVPVSMMDVVEEKIGIRITVCGKEGSYRSEFNSPLGIHVYIKLENDHYSLMDCEEIRKYETTNKVPQDKRTWLPYGAPLTIKGKTTRFYYVANGELVVAQPNKYSIKSEKIFEGFKRLSVSFGDENDEESYSHHRKYPRSSPYHYISIKTDNYEDLVTKSTEYMKEISGLYKESKGKWDLSRYNSYNQAALYIWREMTKQYSPVKPDEEEVKWLSKAENGGLTYNITETYEGPAVEKDFNSFYLSIMNSTDFKCPLKSPSFTTLPADAFHHKDENEFKKLQYHLGIYRCIVQGYHHLFRYQKNNYYTHFSIKSALSLGLEVTMLIDGEPNAMLYKSSNPREPAGMVVGSKLFGPFVKEFFKYKQKKGPGSAAAGKLLKNLWGGLSASKKQKFHVDPNKGFELFPGWEIEEMIPDENDHLEITVKAVEKVFKTPFMRIKPFLPSAGRMIMANLLAPYLDKLLRVHTDGFILTEDIKFTKESDFVDEGLEIGQLKTVKKCNIILENLYNLCWEDGTCTKTYAKTHK